MNTGIELLVKRIKDCPDEFVGGEWNRLMDLFSNFVTAFTDEEKKAVDEALQEAKREVFTGRVMEIIANGEVIGDFQEKYTMKTQGRYTGFPAAPVKAEGSAIQYDTNANAFSVGSTQITQQSLMNAAAQIASLK